MTIWETSFRETSFRESDYPGNVCKPLNFGDIYVVYAGFLSVKCFKFGAFWVISGGFFCKKPRWGKFPLNFWSLLALKLLVGSENIWGCKNGTDNISLQSLVVISQCGRQKSS